MIRIFKFAITVYNNLVASIVLKVKHKNFNHKYRAFSIQNQNGQTGKWNFMSVDYMTPYPYSKKDLVEVYVWYRGKNELYIDNLKIEVFEKK